MIRILGLFLLSGLLFTTLNAEQKERDGGPYIGVGYGMASYNDDDYFDSVVDSNVASYNLYAGAFINKYLSVELDYIKSGQFNVIDSTTSKTTFNYTSITIGALAHYPTFEDSLDFYAKFGAGQSYVSMSSYDGAALVVGAGVSYRIDETFALRLAYDLYTFNYDSDSRGRFNMNMQYAYAAIEVQF
ncbi:porin family protein [bacterium]|nr:porin family protein [bacterium]MBU1884824.1 porin family protein [bacterium]